MSKTQYKEKSLDILNDELSYKKLNRDPTSTFQQKANKIIRELNSNDMLTDHEKKSLMIYNSTAAKFYGLPKIHKPTLSVRPIISSIDTPNSKIALFITNILTCSYNKDNEYYIKDSFEFASFINEKQLPNDFVVISLDVVSLFSNIPLYLVKRSIEKRWNDIAFFCNMPLEQFIKVVEFIFESTYFSFEGVYFKQILGTPMGASVSPIIAQIVMDDLLENCIPKLSFQLPFLKKYVDDIICSVPQGGINEILTTFNSYDNHIQFTVEVESEGSVPFLDTRVIREQDQRIILDWYTKPTSSGRYINYNSHHTEKMKINLVLALKNRINKISHPSLRMRNIDKLYNILINNSYPEKILRKLLYNTITHDRQSNGETHDNQDLDINFIYGSIPYVKDVSPRIINIFKSEQNIKIAQKNLKTAGQLYTKLKDKDDKLKKSNLVYSIPCQNCDLKYIGQTSRCLNARIISHRSDSNTSKRSCALSEHVIDTGHHMNYDEVTILQHEKNLNKRLFLEMVEINQEHNNMNNNIDISGLSSIYSYVLNLKPNDPNVGTEESMSD